jgi:hypothetical protein
VLSSATPSSISRIADAVRNTFWSTPIANPTVAMKRLAVVKDTATPPASQKAPDRCVEVAAPMTSGRSGKTQGDRVERIPASRPAPTLTIDTV